MKVVLHQEWLGHKPGAVLDLRDNVAKLMIERGVAAEVEDKQLKTSSDKMLKDQSTKKK